MPDTLTATVLVAACASVFALGETLLQPTVPVIVNDLAPAHLRGRYNAVSSSAGRCSSAGPLFRLEPQLPPDVNGLAPKRSS